MDIQSKQLCDGNNIPVLGLGTWQLIGRECTDVVRSALSFGYTHIDTADTYGNQKDIARALGGYDRGKLYITSKVPYTELSRERVLASVSNTLNELETAYLDLLLIHWPNRNFDMRDTFRAFEDLHCRGVVRSIGVSNFSTSKLREAQCKCELPISVNQVEFHPYLNQRRMHSYCVEKEITLVAYSPLARGKVLADPLINEIAQRHNCQPAQVCLKWLLDKGVVAIPKAATIKHLAFNIESLEVQLSKEESDVIDSIQRELRVVNPCFADFRETDLDGSRLDMNAF